MSPTEGTDRAIFEPGYKSTRRSIVAVPSRPYPLHQYLAYPHLMPTSSTLLNINIPSISTNRHSFEPYWNKGCICVACVGFGYLLIEKWGQNCGVVKRWVPCAFFLWFSTLSYHIFRFFFRSLFQVLNEVRNGGVWWEIVALDGRKCQSVHFCQFGCSLWCVIRSRSMSVYRLFVPWRYSSMG